MLLFSAMAIATIVAIVTVVSSWLELIGVAKDPRPECQKGLSGIVGTTAIPLTDNILFPLKFPCSFSFDGPLNPKP